MTALRAEGFGGHAEFDGELIKIGSRGLGREANESRVVKLAELERVDFKSATRISNGQIRFAVAGSTTPKAAFDPNSVFFSRRQSDEFVKLREVIDQAIEARGPLTDGQLTEIREAADIRSESEREALEAQAQELRRKVSGVVYAGHVVDYKGYRYGLGLKRPIAGATAEFESGADRSRPTLTRIGGGALLAGPVGAIAGGMFKKDKTKGYVTIVFPDGATVIVEGPVKDEKKMREFANGVASIGASEARRDGLSVSPETSAAEAPADQLLKLKQLLDAGVLTQEQYDAKAAPLLELS